MPIFCVLYALVVWGKGVKVYFRYISLRDTLLLLEQDLSYVGEFDWMSEDTYKSQCENGADNTVSILPWKLELTVMYSTFLWESEYRQAESPFH